MRSRQSSNSFQKNLSLGDCVKKFREAGRKKPRQIKRIDFPPYKLHVEQHGDESHIFQLTLGGEIKLYGTTFIQVRASGELSRVDDDNISVSYASKTLWKAPLFFYGIALVVWLLLFSETFTMMIIGIIVIVAHASWEVVNARNYLDEIPTLLELILAS